MNPITDWLSFDVESVGDRSCYALQPWRLASWQASVRTYSLSWIRNGKMRSRSTAEIDRAKLSQLLLHTAEQGKIIIGWKVAFDMSWLFAMGLREEVYANKWLDAMVLWKSLERTRRTYSLKDAVREFFPQHAGYEEGVDFEGDVENLLRYNELDTEFTLMLALKFWGQLTEREQRSILIDMEDLPVIAERNYKGLEVSETAIVKVHNHLIEQREENYQKLLPYLPEDFNLDSDQQVGKLLFEEWGLPVFKRTEKGAYSVDKESLLEISHGDERAKWVQQYRETTGLLSKCVKAVIKSVQYNEQKNVVHPELNKASTVTDRCTYSSSQNGPAEKK